MAASSAGAACEGVTHQSTTSRPTTPARATPSQAEVFKSISDNVNQPTDGGRVVFWLCVGGGVFIVLALISQRQRRVAAPKPWLHHGKLLKEVVKALPLRRSEIKQLSALADVTRQPDGQPVNSPLTLLLCPSVLARGINNKALKVDRRVLAGVYKKLAKPGRSASLSTAASAPRASVEG